MARRKFYQFRISLQEIAPTIWRRIQVSDLYSFWDLNVAIQDSMGWTDSHLHQFNISNIQTNKIDHIVIPGEEFGETGYELILAGWDQKIKDYFTENNSECNYEYDFGDGWKYTIKFEGIYDKLDGRKYPACLEGKNACPPENVGGITGYQEFIEVMKNKKHPNHLQLVQWFGGLYKSTKFSVDKVKFDSPSARLNTMRSFNTI